jgi:hypothetical protein
MRAACFVSSTGTLGVGQTITRPSDLSPISMAGSRREPRRYSIDSRRTVHLTTEPNLSRSFELIKLDRNRIPKMRGFSVPHSGERRWEPKICKNFSASAPAGCEKTKRKRGQTALSTATSHSGSRAYGGDRVVCLFFASFFRNLLEEFQQRIGGFFGTFFHEPVPGVLQDDDLHVRGD